MRSGIGPGTQQSAQSDKAGYPTRKSSLLEVLSAERAKEEEDETEFIGTYLDHVKAIDKASGATEFVIDDSKPKISDEATRLEPEPFTLLSPPFIKR